MQTKSSDAARVIRKRLEKIVRVCDAIQFRFFVFFAKLQHEVSTIFVGSPLLYFIRLDTRHSFSIFTRQTSRSFLPFEQYSRFKTLPHFTRLAASFGYAYCRWNTFSY